MKNTRAAALLLAFTALTPLESSRAAEPDMTAGWSKDISTQPTAVGGITHPDTQWFRDAKFGIFMHWGLYSEAGNVWDGKNYYGSGEWLMHQAKIPVKDYEKLAATFNPTHFNADDWAKFIHDAGAQYLVITAKHHEGFAMFKSAVSPYNIVDATPYKQDPMAPLAEACRKNGVHFGFYYSQYLDWHEKDGGGNTWDFKKSDKDIKKYYAEKSMPQIRELAQNYGPLSILWFDMPGGLTKDETASFVSDIRKLQPNCLISSRVGQGLGDFSDLGDSEFPPAPIAPPWEALFTHTDSWGFQKYDQNFKSPTEIIHLLAATAARGGNLILNVGPDGEGNIPQKSLDYLREVGKWLAKNGLSIYGTTASPIPDQPWGVCTSNNGKDGAHIYVHVFDVPKNHFVYLPIANSQKNPQVTLLNSTDPLPIQSDDNGLSITLPANLPESPDTIINVFYSPQPPKDAWQSTPYIITKQFDSLTIDSSRAHLSGDAKLESKTSSRYFGNWHHDSVVTSQKSPTDTATFNLRVLEPGDYKISLEYACPDPAQKNLEGSINIIGGGDTKTYTFQTCATAPFDSHQPLLFFHHPIGIVSLQKGDTTLSIHPTTDVPNFFWLHRIILKPQ